MHRRLFGCSIALLFAIACYRDTVAQTLSYPDPTLHHIYPAGGQQGQTIAVRFGPLPTLQGATQVIIDGPGGITATDLKRVGDEFGATFAIAPDALPGRRLVRLLGGGSGLTSFRYFFVGQLPEMMEKEPNEAPQSAQEVSTPVVVNGRIERDLDIDCFAFHAKAQQRIVVAVLAHGMDSGERRNTAVGGFLDTSLELLDEKGVTLATAGDTLGLDPALEFVAPAEGRYTVRLQTSGYRGTPSSVYRLTLGDVPYPTHVFPAGGQRGQSVDVEVRGLNLPTTVRQKITVAKDPFEVQYLGNLASSSDGRDIPFLRGDWPELVEAEPNNDAPRAQTLPLPITVNGRFELPGDEDWYRVRLEKGRGVLLDVAAQRKLRGNLDTMLEIFDSSGKKLIENDDGALYSRPNHCAHDFSSADSRLPFTAPADGEYLVRISDQSGAAGPQAIYRLSASPLEPDFQIYQWPDVVPVWGPGGTASFVVELYHWAGFSADIELSVEGLPAGWQGSTVKLSASTFQIYQAPTGTKVLLTITAPADAPLNTVAPFRVVGRAQQDGRRIEHEARYLTLYGNSHNDGMLLRDSPGARAVVAPALDCRLETTVTTITAKPGQKVEIPVKIHRIKPGAEFGLVVNGPTVAASCAFSAPISLTPNADEFLLPLTINPELRPGTRGIVVARSWSSDLRGGRPGPCTPLIQLTVLPP